MPASNADSFANADSNYKDILLLFLVYVLAHGLMLFNNGIFWDDWVYYGKEQSSLLGLSAQWGNAYFGYYTSFIFSPPGNLFLGRCIIFLSYFVSALFLYEVLKGIVEIDPNSRFILVMLFEIFPLNNARIALCCSFMAIGYVLFFFGLGLTSRFMSKMSIPLRLFALIIFFISFSILNSLIAFYVLVPMYILYKYGWQISSPANLSKTFKKYLDFFLLPILFWIVKSQYLIPFGLYEGYNAITIHSLLYAPFKMGFSFFSSFVVVLIKSAEISSRSVTILALLFIFAAAILRLKFPRIDYGYNLKLFALGLLFFAIGVVPYLAVGKFPELHDWNSRHQLLLPLGASFILYYGLMTLAERVNLSSMNKKILLSFLMAVFLSANILGYADYQRDWYKQVSLIENIKASETIRSDTTILFEDHTTDLNANNRSYRFYEYGGMMLAAFRDESRLGCDLGSFQGIPYYKKYREYNLRAYSWGNSNSTTVAIDRGNLDLGLTDLPKLMYLEHFQQERFYNLIKAAIRLSY
jgi:hypothetical protein